MKHKSKTGQSLYKSAKRLIPGGNQLLSKRPEMFLPDLWPAYYKKAKGYEVWDLDDNKYFDFAAMGVGSCALGYADQDVNSKVTEALKHGSMSTLNSYEEVELAKKLIELHPWSDMTRFARTGGEACAIAVRIARAATSKDKILFCGYHGWADWYISSNLVDRNNLNDQLLKGLDSKGVPRHLAGTAIPFKYNDIEIFKNKIKEHKGQIAAIFMEPIRSTEPKSGFLESIRQIALEENIILIFDEITSGFRKNIGGIHLTYNVEPDIAVFGKALGNGYPISAIIGKEKFMNAAQETFISSTYWTERLGFVAALATIDKFEKENVPNHLIESGKKINEGWQQASEASGLQIKISGLEPLTHIEFLDGNAPLIQTIYTQEMLKKDYLVGSNVYTTFAYNNEIIDQFSDDSKSIFKFIKQAIDSGKLESFLDNKVKHSGFDRLT